MRKNERKNYCHLVPQGYLQWREGWAQWQREEDKDNEGEDQVGREDKVDRGRIEDFPA